jgi:hypothetical protein
MTPKSIIVTLLFAVMVAPAAAQPRQVKPAHRACVDRPATFSWQSFLFGPPPQANGCAPAVYLGGQFIGQDPDPNIRLQLRRDPTNEGSDLNIR